MDAQKTAVVVCEAVAPEIESITPEGMQVRVLEFGLHDFPGKLHEKLQELLQELDSDEKVELVLLGYGICAEGAIGLKTERIKLVMPKTDDCIALFLGSRATYEQRLKKEPGTFYLTKGWIEKGETPLAVYNQKPVWTKKYSEEKVHWLAREVIKNYTKIALIKTGAYDLSPYEEYAKKTAKVFEKEYEEVTGSLNMLEALLHGPWDDRFVVVEPGVGVTKEMFLA
jgi:hypothetical protein